MKHKTLKERLEEFYGVPFDQVPRRESEPEIDWGPDVGHEIIEDDYSKEEHNGTKD